jgi:hypothetical protein
MTYLPRNGAVAEVVLGSLVADSGTVTVAYPSGFSQLSFNAGLEDYGQSYVVLNENDKVAQGSPGVNFTYGSSDITITNNTGASWAAGTKVRAFFAQRRGNNVMLLTIPIDLASVAVGDVVTDIRPGVDGYIENVEFVAGKAVTTGSKLATLNLEIDTTNVTGGLVALTSAALTPKGARVAGSQITGANRLVKESKLSVEASAVTAFTEGDGFLLIRIRLDTL